jgi:hypothetical protein
MTKSEKRYFKLVSSRHTIGDENNYVRIFDYLDKLDSYDEDKLFDHFKGESFLNRFSITKKRLYDHILNALDSFHSANSVDAQLHTMLHSAHILFEKSLYDQSRRILNSAEKLAKKHEKSHILLQILGQRKKLIETHGYLDADQEVLEELFKEESSITRGVDNYNRLWAVKSRLFSRLSKKGVARCQDEVESYKQVCNGTLELEVEELSTSEAKYLFHHIHSAYCYATGDLECSLVHLKHNLELFEEIKTFKIEPNKQFSVLTNAIYIADKLGDHRSSISLLNQLKEFARSIKASEDLEIKIFSSISSIELSMNLRKGDFESAQRNAIAIEEKLTSYGAKIAPVRRAFLEFKLAVVYIGCGEFNTALKWTNKILNDSDLDKTEDLIGFTQLLDLLLHIELNHSKLLPYTLKSVQRFFKTRNRLYSFEQVFLRFISKMIKCEDKFEMEDLWEDLYNDLATMTNDDRFESVALDYFDFKSWAESKLKQKSFDLIVKEKYNRNLKAAS